MSDYRIAANFAEIAQAADDLTKEAEKVMTDLDDFHNYVANFINENWSGEATESFQVMQKKWGDSMNELNTTLKGASQLVHSGNADLESTDKAMSQLF